MPTDDPAPSTDAGPQPASACEIELQNPGRSPEVGARRLRPWLRTLLAELAPEARTFTARFVSDREMRRLNFEYRQKNRPTDVLSFPGDLGGSTDDDFLVPSEASLDEIGGHLGDVVIALPTARRQADERGHEIARELRLLLLHGVLHCLGHDHEEDDGEMEALETRLRQRFLAEGAA